jgi:hypothetical protein
MDLSLIIAIYLTKSDEQNVGSKQPEEIQSSDRPANASESEAALYTTPVNAL